MRQNPTRSRRDDTAVNAGTAAHDFASVARSYWPRVFRFLLASLRDVDLAETLTQECFLRAHRHWSTFRGESNLMTWLTRIAINLQKDHWRSGRIQFWRQAHTNSVDLDNVGEWLSSGESSPEQRLVARDQVKQIWKVVENLNELQRTLFLLRYEEELELSEIARTTGLRKSTVKAHLSRVLVRVRTELGGVR